MDVQPLFDDLILWPMAKRNYDALQDVAVRQIDGVSPSVTLMFNPARVRSTAAAVDVESVSRRPCFLCHANRPPEQRFLPWRDYDVLVNPFPIFRHHLTIVSTSHTPQTPQGRMADLFALAQELPSFTVFFNGAQCGASAPDHAHFQAAADLFARPPFFCAVLEDAGRLLEEVDGGRAIISEGSGRLAYRIEATRPGAAELLFERLFLLRRLRDDMLNVLARVRPGGRVVDMVVIPRRLFRPWQFFADGEEKILVSPAAVEVAGFFVLPRREDFDKMTAADAEDILRQVCYASDNELLRES